MSNSSTNVDTSPERPRIADLRNLPSILPSMLLCDFGNLQREVERLESAGAVALHLDVMDGIFVPNMTYGLPIVAAFRKLTQLPLDVHLMIQHPERYAKSFVDAGANMITFHIEAVSGDNRTSPPLVDVDPRELLETIRKLGCTAGMAINPSTPFEAISGYIPDCDAVLIMSVDAGFGGQSFNPVALERLSKLRLLREQGRTRTNLLIEVDGGVNASTIDSCVQAGAELLVVGSAIFRESDYGQAMAGLKSKFASRGRSSI